VKEIRSAADLAINGAAPAFNEAIHVGRPNLGNRALFLSYVEQILDSEWLTNNGSMVQEFERRIAEHVGAKHCIAMCNGTLALEIAIRALGLLISQKYRRHLDARRTSAPGRAGA
jgi:dTDP-4-amino-4,6-dideoxygalactose transaminase